MMREGLSTAIQSTIDQPLPNELCEEDFRMDITQIHKGFRMQTFAGPVFAWLRRSLGMEEKEYQHSLASQGGYLQFISNSKSKANFFLTNDKRFFLKTQNKREVRFLLANLRVYTKHLESYPHSLLVKFLGVHRIKIPHEREKYFIVMQSVFYPDERINARYDIKGCEVSRWTDPAPEKSQLIVVLKDMNFEGKFITLDHQRSWLLRQVEIDTSFLRRLNVLDYSLLLAHQPLHHDERGRTHSFATLIMRAKKSVYAGSAPTDSDPPTFPGTALEDGAALLAEETNALSTEGEEPIPLEELHSRPPGGTVDLDLQEFKAQNRRLLPNFKNPLHVIDGPELRYFVGIIDIFTVYGFRKRVEHVWKRLRYPGKTFSTVSPSAYARRLCRWVENHTK
ncbi:phosphatidylinositol 4-phosphate 5-kinase-like protein 1 [Scleropages formosus]|uniref:phosphatidylinositol 4-phosphate 5-kinase-like protein 1 n=1 Tax=Scleropages formosus TaxID=113540 RepID=UPI0010FA9CC0|nr:phosphatidylinositol 4-phosphate 5-kinase-like protein 1 [Scleropages formosus]